MKHNPDDRSNNAARIQNAIDHTIGNIRAANDMIAETDNAQTKQELEAKNQKREEALCNMRQEIKDETMAQKQNNQ